MENNKHKILLGLTTTPGSDWREKIREIDELGLKEIALFPTCLEADERRELYALLEKTKLEHIPHVHLRDGMTENEVDYLAGRYRTEVFNMHADRDYRVFLEMKALSGRLFMENCWKIDEDFYRAVDACSGVCLDCCHWEDLGIRQKKEDYADFALFLEKHRIGCCHISSVRAEQYPDWSAPEKKMYGSHYMHDLSDLDYMKKYAQYLPRYVSLELENSFAEQIKAKEYLEKIIC
ncbi:MAG: hypothetical protein V1867_04040 [Candidatus Falkowbacteria bacterium]